MMEQFAEDAASDGQRPHLGAHRGLDPGVNERLQAELRSADADGAVAGVEDVGGHFDDPLERLVEVEAATHQQDRLQQLTHRGRIGHAGLGEGVERRADLR